MCSGRRRALRVLVALLALAVISACGTPLSPTDRAWAQEVTGAIARINDIVALDLLPAVLGQTNPPPIISDAKLNPDFGRLLPVCDQLGAAATSLGDLGGRAPHRFRSAGTDAAQTATGLTSLAASCHVAAAARDLEAVRRLGPMFTSVGTAETKLGKLLPSVGCPPELRAQVKSCQLK